MQLAPAASDTRPKKKKNSAGACKCQCLHASAADATAALRPQTRSRQTTKRNQFNRRIHKVHEEICHCFQGGTELYAVSAKASLYRY